MICGIGVDIIEIDRIKNSIEKFGKAFTEKIFTSVEIEYCESKKNKVQHYAARFAAKEAVIKAMSKDQPQGFKWTDIEIFNELNGMPGVKLFGKFLQILGDDKEIKISISHSHNYVTSFAVLHKKEKDA